MHGRSKSTSIITAAFALWSLSVSALSNPEDSTDADIWRNFGEQLKAASQFIHHPDTPRDPVTIADGYQMLPRIFRLAWEYAFEYADPEHPILFKSTDSYLTNGWQTSDAVYHSAVIDGSKNYRLSGKRGTAPFFELTANEGFDGMHGQSRMVSSITEDNLTVDANNNIDILIGPGIKSGAGLATTANTNFVFLRQYSHNWEDTEAAQIKIERLPESADSSQRFSLEAPSRHSIDGAFQTTLRYMLNYLKTYHTRAANIVKNSRNTLVAFPYNVPDKGSTMPAGHRFAVGAYDVTEKQALVVTFKPTEAPYWAFQMGNFWGETLAYQAGAATVINNQSIKQEADGSVRLVISQGKCPATALNCLTSLGRQVGIVIYRQARQLELFPEFHTQLIELD
ncbi:MAG: hypothetical protein HOC23_08530 [Halieaceae bacterium]|nr:hypothetical protein [Halieaceae bacterium]